ncbi:MAG: hypothetical protein R6U46_07785 [Marinilabilia sp.]
MTTLLIAIADKKDLDRLLPPARTLAKAFNHKILISTFHDKTQTIKQLCQASAGHHELKSSANNLVSTITGLTDSREYDISIVLIPESVIDLERKRKATKFLSAFRKLKVPYLIMPESIPPEWKPTHIFFPVSLREGDKETAAWAGFLTRYHNSNLRLLYPGFKSPEDQKRLWVVLLFIQRLFERSNIHFETLKKGHHKRELLDSTIAIANETPTSLIVVPATRFYSPEYYFTGSPEFKLLKNRGNTPVLFVNPRHDLYVPCG